MENMQQAEELVRGYLVFRGFTNTLKSFETELCTDIGKSFQVNKVLDLIFAVYIPKFHAEKLVGLFRFFKQCFSSWSETTMLETLSKLECSVLRCYIVNALQSGRKDKVVEFFGINGDDLLVKSSDWTPWFAIPYLKNPSMDPQFRVYFSKEWYEALRLSVRNFFSEIFNARLPALLKICSEKNTISSLKKDNKLLNQKVLQLQALLEEKEVQLGLSKRSMGAANSSSGIDGENLHLPTSSEDIFAHATSHLGRIAQGEQHAGTESAKFVSAYVESSSWQDSYSASSLHALSSGIDDTAQKFYGSHFNDNDREMHREEEFPEETFLGHTSSITRCRFSASGNNIASASVDGTVRIWTYDSSIPASRNATIYCGAEIMSLDWECKSDRLLLIGTAEGGIKAWNVDAKRVVCDLNTTDAFPSVLDLKCSPVEPIFVSATSSQRLGSKSIDSLGYASLTVWNMKTWKVMTVLPLGEDPPAITSLCFNHNGKILAASATDGMIHIYLNGACKTKVVSYGQKLLACNFHFLMVASSFCSVNGTRFSNMDITLCSFSDSKRSKYCRDEMSLDANGRQLLVTSGSVRAPIYQVQGHSSGFRTLPHTSAITTVDWHPTLPIFLTGSADNSVRVTSIPSMSQMDSPSIFKPLHFADPNIVSRLESPGGLFATMNKCHIFSLLYHSMLLHMNHISSSTVWSVDWIKKEDLVPDVYAFLIKDIVHRLNVLEGVVRWVNRAKASLNVSSASSENSMYMGHTPRIIKDEAGQSYDSFEGVAAVLVDYFTNLIGTPDPLVKGCSVDNLKNLLNFSLPVDAATCLIREVSDDEIKEALFRQGKDKSPGPDGFTSGFFKAAWDIVGSDFIAAVRYFFQTSYLLPAFNATVLVLVPKSLNTCLAKEFRPISCCSVVYKTITRVLVNRLTPYFLGMISHNQSAFVKGRNIVDNTLLAQEIVKGYSRRSLSPRCAIKIDLQKAFDSVNWSFLLSVLEAMGLPSGARGIRQGDPLSPYLFVIVMNILSSLLNAAAKQRIFRFHPKCKRLSLCGPEYCQ
ncbi:putative membrane-associated kinase regulator 6-like [Hibiscus syriacus]|uniref:Membrane-associated kinase regulator 6-like n=1 Tax=Hibiscus syriacus TaxID=106335 RepID=A0A6A2WSB8_HIBSY|nr:putative membrane-associated kinase regulator 6-like [Hibiscus syriacus]